MPTIAEAFNTHILDMPAFHITGMPHPIGPEGQEMALLKGVMHFAGAYFHIELIQVEDVPVDGQDNYEQVPVLNSAHHHYEELNLYAGERGPFDTVHLGTRDYVMVIIPFCR